MLSGNSGAGMAIEADLTTSFLAVYSEQNNNPYQRPSAIVISVSGTTPTVGSATTLSSTNITNKENTQLVFDEEYGRWLVFYDQDTTSHTYVARTITIGSSATSITTGSEISLGSDISWYDSSGAYQDLIYDPYLKKTYFYYRANAIIDNDVYPWLAVNKVTIATDNTLSFGTECLIEDEAIHSGGMRDTVGGEYYGSSGTHFAAAGKTHHVFVFEQGSPDEICAKAVKVQNTTNNMTTENYIGISTDDYADTVTATIGVTGSADDNQSGLTTAKKYYLQGNNTLASLADPIGPSVEAGIALSATKLLIKG